MWIITVCLRLRVLNTRSVRKVSNTAARPLRYFRYYLSFNSCNKDQRLNTNEQAQQQIKLYSMCCRNKGESTSGIDLDYFVIIGKLLDHIFNVLLVFCALSENGKHSDISFPQPPCSCPTQLMMCPSSLWRRTLTNNIPKSTFFKI
jgi:hypothetical protein